MTRIRGGRGDAFRTELPRLFKTLARSGKPEASGKPCGVTEDLSAIASLTRSSWKQIAAWLRQLDRLPRPVRRGDVSSEWL